MICFFIDYYTFVIIGQICDIFIPIVKDQTIPTSHYTPQIMNNFFIHRDTFTLLYILFQKDSWYILHFFNLCYVKRFIFMI